MKDLYLYHATDKKNLKSIMKNGLLVNPPTHNWKGMYCDNMIFLAFDAYVAEDYAMSSDNTQDDIDIVVLKVHLNDLNADNIYYDWNNRCEYMNEINSCVYTLDIPSSNLQICNPKDEPSQSIYDFEGSYLFDIISYTFDVKIVCNDSVPLPIFEEGFASLKYMREQYVNESGDSMMTEAPTDKMSRPKKQDKTEDNRFNRVLKDATPDGVIYDNKSNSKNGNNKEPKQEEL